LSGGEKFKKTIYLGECLAKQEKESISEGSACNPIQLTRTLIRIAPHRLNCGKEVMLHEL
jgi:hypothetical protein